MTHEQNSIVYYLNILIPSLISRILKKNVLPLVYKFYIADSTVLRLV